MQEPPSKKYHVITVIIGLMFIASALFIIHYTLNFYNNGLETTAVITDKKVHKGKDDKYTDWKLEFVTIDGKFIQADYKSNGNVFIPSAEIGDKVTILYFPDNPQRKIHFSTPAGDWVLPFMFIIFGMAIIIYAPKIAELSGKADRKKKEKLER